MLNNLTQASQEGNPGLTAESTFKFSCHKDLSCFTHCCADVNIFLTPYDVLRMRKALNISSEKFISDYLMSPFLTQQKIPLVLLRMRDDERKSCPFVTEAGCSIYEDRPWACRMFPLEEAPATGPDQPDGGEYRLFHQEGFSCLGLEEAQEWTVAAWRRDQEIDTWEAKNRPYRDITLHPQVSGNDGLGLERNHIFYITCYDLDRFRRLVLESSFLERFEVAPDTIAAIKTDDEALLEFGYAWLRFSLFGERTIKVKDRELARQKEALARQARKSKQEGGS